MKKALLIAAGLLLFSAAPASAALLRDTPVYAQGFTEPGAVGAEAYSALPYSFVWYADKPSSGGSQIYGYFQDHSSAAAQVTISRAVSDPEGELGKVSGIAFDARNKMLYVADMDKNRILWYPRLDNALPGAQINYAAVGQMPGPVSSGEPAGSDDGEFNVPGGIATYDTGTETKLIAADMNNHRIQIFTAGPTGLSAPQSVAMPGVSVPHDVAVDPVTGDIYVAITDYALGLDAVQVFSSAGADLGRFGSVVDNGFYNQIDFDPDKHVIYGSKAARVDVISPQSRQILGSYDYSQFSEAGPGGNRMVKFMDVFGPSGQLFVARFNPDGVMNGGSDPEDPTPAQSYLTPNPPSCVVGAPLNVASGATLNFTPNCTDPDGSTNQEFMVESVSRGTADHSGDYDSIDFHAPAGSGVVRLGYRVWTIDGISPVYQQDIYVTDSTKVASELLPGRGLPAETAEGGVIANEGVGGLAKYLWWAGSDGIKTVLYGYDQVDAGGGSISAVDCGSSPVGDLGNYVSGIAYTSTNLLLAADYEHDRVVAYPRQDNDADPVDCDNAISIASVSGRTLMKARSLAVNGGTAYAVVSSDLDPDGGIVSFDPQTQTENGYVGYSFPDQQLGPLAFGGGHLFAGVNGAGTIEVFNPDLTSSAIGPLDAGSPDDFVSLSAHESTGRLFAMKPNEVDIFSLSTGTLLGKIQGAYWGGANSSISTIENYQQFAVSSNIDPALRDFWSNPNPLCTPGAPKDVVAGATITFTPSCTDESNSTVREFTVTNSQTHGSAAITTDRKAVTYTAGATPGQDDIAYRVQTQDGISVEKHQLINVTAPPAEEKPVVRETANLQLDSGDVYVKVPGSNEFVKLTADMLIPVGTIIDATQGKAHITMANKDGSTYDGIFWEGVFQVLQGSGNFPITTMKLRNDMVGRASAVRQMFALAAGDPYKAMIARKGKKKNGLWGNAKGKYKTSGKGGSAAVRGTIWYVADYQCGSLFKVKRGKVLIDPAAKGKNFYLTTGKQRFLYYRKCVR